jgi:signal transduction histidine kinase
MRINDSIRARLARSYLVFFTLVVLLGGSSIGMIAYENDVSSEIRDRWLENTRLIGDFENFTSDYRSAEGSLLLGRTVRQNDATAAELTKLARIIRHTEDSFGQIPHDQAESELYRQFLRQWESYQAAQRADLAALQAGDREGAVQLYQTASQIAYGAVSDTLEKLRKYNISEVLAATGRAEKTNNNVLMLIGLAVICTDLLALIAFLYVRRSTFNPLIDLIDKMQRIAQNETNIGVYGAERNDEIGQMARAVILFKENIIALDGSRQKLEQQAVVLLEKIEEEQQLAMHQRNFVSMVSHEFRTPLNVIDGQAQRLMRHKQAIEAAEIDERGGAIRAAVLRMTNLIDTLLDANRLMDGESQLYLQPLQLDITSLVRDVCQQNREIFPHAQIRESFDQEPLFCWGDSKLIFQAISNVIGNSIKYSPRNNLIEVGVYKNDEHVYITVSDNGIGIPESDINNLFKRYYRGSNVSGIVGTGIGLYLVKMVIDHHRGSIEVSSKVGIGTVITVALPCDWPAPQELAAQ